MLGPNQKSETILWKEINATPLFMNSADKFDLETNDSLAAIHSLIYSDSPNDIASNFKNQGNDWFKSKNYSQSKIYYSKAIDALPTDLELTCSLYSNRAAVNLILKNYGQVLKDCQFAIQLKYELPKVWYRSAQACLALDFLDEAIDSCNRGLALDPDNSCWITLINSIKSRKYELDLVKIRKRDYEKKLSVETQILKDLFASRNIKMTVDGNIVDQVVEYIHPLSGSHKIHLDVHGNLVFPVVLLYPIHNQSDFIAEFNELDSVQDHLNIVFERQAPWDTRHEYRIGELNVYLFLNNVYHQVDVSDALENISINKEFQVVDGVVCLYIVPKGIKA